MKFLSVATFTALAAFVSAASRVKEFVRIEGLEGNRVNGAYSAILKTPEETGNGRTQVLAVVESKVLAFDPASTEDFSSADYFFNALVKPENLNTFNWNRPQQRPTDEIISEMLAGRSVSNWITTPLSPEDLEVLDCVTVLLWKICKEDYVNILRNAGIIRRFRVIGAWICQNYGHAGMVYICENDRRMHEYIERVWNGIGVWMA